MTSVITRRRVSSGEVFVYSIPIFTIVAASGNIGVLGFTLRGWSWILPLVMSMVLLVSPRAKRIEYSWHIWLPWFCWVVFKTDFTDRNAVQRFGLLITPIFVLCAAASLRSISVKVIKKSYLALFVGSVLVYCGAVADSHTVKALADWYVLGGIAMTFTLLAVASLSYTEQSRLIGYTCLIVCFAVLVLTESRMPLLVIPAMFIVGYSKDGLRARLALGMVIIILALWAFHTEPVQRSLFHRNYGDLNDLLSFNPQIVNMAGRLTVWPLYMENINSIWFGDGSASSVYFGQSIFGNTMWAHPHNEYIRVLFDYGVVGVILLSIPVLHLVFIILRQTRTLKLKTDSRWLSMISVNGILVILLLGISGNSLIYIAYIGNMVFMTVGSCWSLFDSRKAN